MHRLDDASSCGLEVPIGPILASLVDRFTETGNFKMVELVLEIFQREGAQPVPNPTRQRSQSLAVIGARGDMP